MMTIDHHSHYLRTVRSAINTATYPIEYLVTLPTRIYYWSSESLASRSRLLSDNNRLKEKQIRLELQLQKLAALEQENSRLRELLLSSKRLVKEHSLIAEILSVDLHPSRQQIILNKGTRDGTYEGQPILGSKGIIGQIDKASPFSSIAILISDPNHALLGTLARSGQRSLIFGTGNTDTLDLRHITNNADIKIGDLVVTSGLDNRYPANYPIAKITNIQETPDKTFMKVEAKPLANLNTIREVLLIWSNGENAGHTAKGTNTHQPGHE